MPVVMCAGISVWHPSPCVYVTVSQLHPLPPLCQHQNRAHCRVRPGTHRAGQSGQGNGAVFSQLHLTRALPVCSSHWCARLLPSRTPVMPGAKPSRASCHAQCATLVCWHEGSGDVLACLPGRVLCSGSPLQHLSPCTWRMRSLSSLSLGQGPLLPHYGSFMALLHAGWAALAVADVLLCTLWVVCAVGPRATW